MKVILRSPVVWVAVAAVAALAFGYFLVNLGAAKSPVANTRGLPVAIVDRDAGAVAGDERLNVGGDVVDRATASEKIGDKVDWTRLDVRSEALRGISEGKYYGALVLPEDLSEAVAELSGGPRIPVAILNEDRGAEPVERVVEGAVGRRTWRAWSGGRRCATPGGRWKASKTASTRGR